MNGNGVICGLAWGACLVVAMADDNVGTNRWEAMSLSAVTAEKEMELPPLAVVESTDGSGETWQKSGSISGGLPVARADFRKSLERQGWRFDKVVPLDSGRQIRELCLWTRGKRSVMVMLWESSAGKCGFALGEMRQGKPGKTEGDKK